MDAIILAGRILFGMLFVGSGVNHFAQRKAMAGYAASKGVPAAELAVLGSGLVLVAGGLMVAVGIFPGLGALALAATLLVMAPTMHAFWKESDPQARQQEQIQFMKDVALLGAALVIFAAFSAIDLGLSVTGTVFSF